MKKSDKINKIKDSNKTLYIIIAVIVILVLAFLVYNYFFDDRDVKSSGIDAASIESITVQPPDPCPFNIMEGNNTYKCIAKPQSGELNYETELVDFKRKCLEEKENYACKELNKVCCLTKCVTCTLGETVCGDALDFIYTCEIFPPKPDYPDCTLKVYKMICPDGQKCSDGKCV